MAWLEIERNVLAWGEVLRGSLVIQGGRRSYPTEIPVRASLGYRHTLDRSEFRPLASTLVLPTQCLIGPGATQHFPFQLTIPDTTPFQHRVELNLPMHRSEGTGPSLGIQVVPPTSCTIIASQFCALTQMQLREWERSQEGDVVGWFYPLDEQSAFKQAAFKFFGSRPPWRGRLLLIRRSRWRWWYGDHECLDLPTLALDPDTIREQIRSVLHQAGYRPGVAGTLPLPSEAGTARPGDLPVPVKQPPPPTPPGPPAPDED